MRPARLGGVFCAVLLLAACAGGRETTFAPLPQTGGSLGEPNKPGVPPRAKPTLEVTLEATGQVALLTVYAERLEADAATLRIWRTGDGAQVVLRDGVLIATRGLGNDMESADVTAALDAVGSLMPTSGPHTLYVRTGENGIAAIILSCNTRKLGVEAIETGKRASDTVHMQAICTGGPFMITNDYWVDPAESIVRKSRQWAGPELGYMQIRLLRE